MTTNTVRAEMINLTAGRLAWLRCLAAHGGEIPWTNMPKQAGTNTPMTNKTWLPLVDNELITARYGQRNFREREGWLFSITDKGIAALRNHSERQP